MSTTGADDVREVSVDHQQRREVFGARGEGCGSTHDDEKGDDCDDCDDGAGDEDDDDGDDDGDDDDDEDDDDDDDDDADADGDFSFFLSTTIREHTTT